MANGADDGESENAALRYSIQVLLANNRSSLYAIERALMRDDSLKKRPEVHSRLSELAKDASAFDSVSTAVEVAAVSRSPDGITTITSPNWPGGLVLAMDRLTFERCRLIPSRFPLTALYFLHEDRDPDGEAGELYIGESKNVNARVAQHQGGKDFWSHVVIASQEGINKSHAQAIESELIRLARVANRYKVNNSNLGQGESLGENDRTVVKGFVAGVSGLLGLSNYDFLRASGSGLFTYELPVGGRDRKVLRLSVRLLDPERGLVRILEGSKIRVHNRVIPDELKSLAAYGELRGEEWIFTRDVEICLTDTDGKCAGVSTLSLKSQNLKPLYSYIGRRASS